MAATHNEYRTYLRSPVDIEAGQHRFHPVPSSEPTYRSLLIGILAVMGLLQVASSVAILLHLTGYLQEVDLSTTPHQLIEEVPPEPVVNALKDPGKRRGCKPPKDLPKVTPSAHLPIKADQEFTKKADPITIEWNGLHGTLRDMTYQSGKLFVTVKGLYYVYAKTCFRYYKLGEESGQMDISNTQLIQYVFHESIKQNNNKPGALMKTGSTMRWNNTSYNMYCAQQGRAVLLDKGDALFINVSNAWMLDKEAEGTYFGAIKMGN